MFISTISLKFDVRTRNWPGIDFQPLEFNFEFYFWRFRGGGLAEFQQGVKSPCIMCVQYRGGCSVPWGIS